MANDGRTVITSAPIADSTIATEGLTECSVAQNANNGCSNNIIKPCYNARFYTEDIVFDSAKAVHTLNNNIMLGWYGDYSSMETAYQSGTSDPGLTYNLPHDNYFAPNCCANTLYCFGSWKNKFGEGCSLNVLYKMNWGTNTENSYCNTFGKNCTGNIIWGYNNSFGEVCYSNAIDSQQNTFGNNCSEITIECGLYSDDSVVLSKNNRFGNGCRNITLSISGYVGQTQYGYLTFGNYCSLITFNGCVHNCTFGEGNRNIDISDSRSLMQDCYFGDYCENISGVATVKSVYFCGFNSDIKFGSCDYCVFKKGANNLTLDYYDSYNVFEEYCNNIELGYNCTNNIFKNRCSKIKLGSYCNYNVIGENCTEIYFYSGTTGTSGLGYVEHATIETDNRSIEIRTTKSLSSSTKLQRFTVKSGTNVSSTAKVITFDNTNTAYETLFQSSSTTTVSV